MIGIINYTVHYIVKLVFFEINHSIKQVNKNMFILWSLRNIFGFVVSHTLEYKLKFQGNNFVLIYRGWLVNVVEFSFYCVNGIVTIFIILIIWRNL